MGIHEGATLGATLAVLVLLAPAPLLAAPAPAAHFLPGGRAELSPHPRTLIRPEELSRVRARLGRQPYTALFARVWALARRSHDPTDHAVSPTQSRANTARAAALVYLLDRRLDGAGRPAPFAEPAKRRAFAHKAADYLLQMPTASRAKQLDYVLDIHTAQELQLWAETLDLLLGAEPPALEGTARRRATQNVADLAADFHGDYEERYWLYMRALVNNHRSKSAAALGVAALVLNGEAFSATAGRHHDPRRWLDFALRYSDMVGRDILVDPDGGYQECAGYLAYGLINSLGFYWAWYRENRGGDYLVDWTPPHPYYRFHATGPYRVPDLWTDPLLQKQLLWAVRLMRPDGKVAAFDDCTPGVTLPFGALVQRPIAAAPLLHWAWKRQGYPASGSVDMAPLLLATFDDGVEPRSPAQFGLRQNDAMPYAGQVVLRSGWDADAVQVLLMCEHGIAAGWTRTRWGDYVDGAAGHEHPDPGAFALFAFGEPLAIDSGYLGWGDHVLVNNPENHNIVLVDGRGPQIYRMVVPEVIFDGATMKLAHPEQEGGWSPALDGMAYLTAADTRTRGVQAVEIRSRYAVELPETHLRRRATFLGGRFLLIHDRIFTPARAGGEHRYTFQLHGNAGGSAGGSFQTLAGGGLWSRSRARLRAAVVSPEGEPELQTLLAPHDPGNRKVAEHAALRATVRAAEGTVVRFLTLLAPERLSGEAEQTTVERLQTEGGAELRFSLDGRRCRAFVGDRPRAISAGGPPLLLARSAAYCVEPGALYGSFGGSADDPHLYYTARFELDAAGAARAFTAELLGGGDGEGPATLELPAAAGKVPRGACGVEAMAGGKSWRIHAPVPASLATFDEHAPLAAHLALVGRGPGGPAAVPLGRAVTVSGRGSCGALASVARWSWSLSRRPELSGARLLPAGPVTERGAEAVTFSPDLPGLYEVTLVLSAGEARSEARLALEVEGELSWPPSADGGLDAGAPDAAPAPDRGGAEAEGGVDAGPDGGEARGSDGCAVGGGAAKDGAGGIWIGALFALLALNSSMRTRKRRSGAPARR